MRHLLSLEQLEAAELRHLIDRARSMKHPPHPASRLPLAGQHWVLLFSKSSTRTRLSFEVGVRQLGGQAIFLSSNDLQLGRGEPIKDTARVVGRMADGAIIRTFAQQDIEEFARYACIPTINALTDDEHPCQILADVLTYEEKRGAITGRAVTFIGDGASNVARSWIFAAAKLGFELRIAAPRAFWPAPEVLVRSGALRESAAEASPSEPTARWRFASGQALVLTEDLQLGVAQSDLLYTDVWVSMGKEAEASERLQALAGFQLNGAAAAGARPDALIMHCLPAYRGKEIDDSTFEAHAATIFDEAENRLHAQKAVLDWAVDGRA
jgi:ornithine carbamoyltransferase